MFKNRFCKVIKAHTGINDVLTTAIKINILGGMSLLRTVRPTVASTYKKVNIVNIAFNVFSCFRLTINLKSYEPQSSQ